jgi:hypothetical protein
MEIKQKIDKFIDKYFVEILVYKISIALFLISVIVIYIRYFN